jgi:ketosteroid isomerase-like protein
MARKNIEIVRGIYAAWAAGNFRAGTEYLDEHLVFVVRPDFPEFGVFHGPEGVTEFLTRFLEQFERVSVAAERLEDIGGTVVAKVIQHQKGRASGIEGENSYFMLWTFRGGRVMRIETLLHERDALETVGLKDEA